jgi:hypothetical protein
VRVARAHHLASRVHLEVDASAQTRGASEQAALLSAGQAPAQQVHLLGERRAHVEQARPELVVSAQEGGARMTRARLRLHRELV